MWVRPLADSDASCGGKAVGLARLIAAKLPVPDGVVVDDRAFRAAVGELPAEHAEIGHALDHAAERLAVPDDLVATIRSALPASALAVRSSASIEDATTGSAAGVFASVTNITPGDLAAGIRSVWTSALTPLAASYARGRSIQLGVIVQRFVAGERVTIYTRAPGHPDHVLVQRAGEVRQTTREDPDPLVVLALAAERAIDAAITGADVELVDAREMSSTSSASSASSIVNDGGDVWIVQARAIVPAPPPARLTPPPVLFAALVADGRRWTWDVAHNPDPLSPAQQGLVERVERAAIAPWSMRLVAGYLYTSAGALPEPPIDGLEERAATIEARFDNILGGDGVEPDLATALARYLAFYEVWARDFVPLLAHARRVHGADGARPSAVSAIVLAAARGDLDESTALARLAPLAPTWDVAVPTFGERPEVIRAAIVRARASTNFHEVGAVVGIVGELAERDDHYFARAQQLVRRALLRRARQLGIADDDICWLSLDDVAIGGSPDDAHRRASAAKAAASRAAKWAMPLVVGDDADGPAGDVLHGYGSGARISGRVVRFESLASAIGVNRGDVIVTRAITPALAVFVVGCAAIISETGGPLDHGAAIARELGVPFIVGCKDAWSLLRDGMIVTIDGDRAIV